MSLLAIIRYDCLRILVCNIQWLNYILKVTKIGLQIIVKRILLLPKYPLKVHLHDKFFHKNMMVSTWWFFAHKNLQVFPQPNTCLGKFFSPLGKNLSAYKIWWTICHINHHAKCSSLWLTYIINLNMQITQNRRLLNNLNIYWKPSFLHVLYKSNRKFSYY